MKMRNSILHAHSSASNKSDLYFNLQIHMTYFLVFFSSKSDTAYQLQSNVLIKCSVTKENKGLTAQCRWNIEKYPTLSMLSCQMEQLFPKEEKECKDKDEI